MSASLERPTSKATPSTTASPLTLLLVEDDPGDAQLIRLSLNEIHGCGPVTHVTCLAEALAQASQSFDAILLDLSLPDSFGFPTVAAIRGAFPVTPIVVLTGLDDAEMENRVVVSGAQDYLLKGSFDGHSLSRSIRHAMLRYELERQLIEREAEQRTIINLAPDAILTLTSERTIASANPAAARIFGFDTAQSLMGNPIEVILPEFDILLASGQGLDEFRGDHIGLRQGTPFPVATAIARLGPERLLVMAVDISERVQLTNELQELARTDPLTGLANRRAFVEAIDTEFRRYKRSGGTAGVLMIDIDHFKQVNDVYGHDAGDLVLKSLAAELRARVRNTDSAARFGGEEFIILLTDISAERTRDMAERIRRSLDPLTVYSHGHPVSVTISIGATLFHADDCEWSQSVKRADQALYEAKMGGRNRVCITP